MATLVFDHERIGSLKQIGSSDDAGSCFKKFKFAAEHDSDSSGEVESIYSYQDHPTASAHDTSDTSDANDTDGYEVRTFSEVTQTEDSSEPENYNLLENLNSIPHGNSLVDELYLADLSSSTSDDEETQRLSLKQCEKCKKECEFTLCLKCFRQRRTYLPPRPKGRRRKNKAGSHFDRHGSQGSLAGSQDSLKGSQVGSQGGDAAFNKHQTSQQGTSSESPLNLCKCCFASPVDGAFVHKNTVHSLYCYKCSVRQWRMRGRCPLCNMKLCQVAKIFPVED